MSSSATQLAPKKQEEAKPKLAVLLVEDNQFDAELVLRALQQSGYDVSGTVVQDEATFLKALRANPPEIVLADYNLPDWTGMETLNVLLREGLDIPVILVSGALGDVTAVESIKRGITDYVLKDGLARLPQVVRRALREKYERGLRHLAEEDLAKKVDELARSNADLEQFANVASHDLQEPLRMVAAYTQLLAERYRGKLDEDADKFIGYASEGALRMQMLIQDLLAFSRVGRNATPNRSIDCNSVMVEVLQTLSTPIQESGALIKFDALPTVCANHTQIVQVFQNLIGNAIKFRGIDPPEISITSEKQDGQWLFTMRDNGIGIPKESLENVFVVFQRLHGRTEYPGNGIGLAICKKIIERYGGRVWVESQVGNGSAFKFTLPPEPADEFKREQP